MQLEELGTTKGGDLPPLVPTSMISSSTGPLDVWRTDSTDVLWAESEGCGCGCGCGCSCGGGDAGASDAGASDASASDASASDASASDASASDASASDAEASDAEAETATDPEAAPAEQEVAALSPADQPLGSQPAAPAAPSCDLNDVPASPPGGQTCDCTPSGWACTPNDPAPSGVPAVDGDGIGTG